MSMDDRTHIKHAIEVSKSSRSEPGKISPMVGVVVVKEGKVLTSAYRGETNAGDHAEYVAIEKTLGNEVLAGSTVYTTLEPCTTRNEPKEPCARRLIDRKVSRVVIGMLDPNPSICGKGVRLLRDHNIETVLFPPDLAAEVEDLNREFRRFIEHLVTERKVNEDFVARYVSRPLDEWYKALNYIYSDRNFYRDPLSIFAHMVEVIGGLSQLASGKNKPGTEPKAFLPKALAWWFALCGKLGITSVSDLVWLKFPGVCPYCQREECDSTICKQKKKVRPVPPWSDLRDLGKNRKRPYRLGEWQRMFRKIYKPHHKAEFESTFARLTEELGELAEAVRVFPAAPGYFLSEAADVFAWLMNIQNNIDFEAELQESDYGNMLEQLFCRAYPDYCLDCKEQRCICPPILDTTIGRIAHEVPDEEGLFDIGRIFMTPDKARDVFRPPL
jgi:pyrimidine deaminase RibD-like protein/NTP pyrophosphatase (non-canonical NTP hydrolase)